MLPTRRSAERPSDQWSTLTLIGILVAALAILYLAREVFIPFALLAPLRNVAPKSGTRWRANFYRVDHDGGKPTSWDWARVGPDFHEFRNFGTMIFD